MKLWTLFKAPRPPHPTTRPHHIESTSTRGCFAYWKTMFQFPGPGKCQPLQSKLGSNAVYLKKKMLVQKIVGSKKSCVKKLLVPKNLGPQFWVQNKFGSNNQSKKILVQKLFINKIFWSTKLLGQKNF